MRAYLRSVLRAVRRVPRNVRRSIAAFAMAVTGLLVTAAPSFAVTATPDPLGGIENTPMNSVKSWLTTYGAPLVFSLLAIGLIIVLAVKYVKRGARSA